MLFRHHPALPQDVILMVSDGEGGVRLHQPVPELLIRCDNWCCGGTAESMQTQQPMVSSPMIRVELWHIWCPVTHRVVLHSPEQREYLWNSYVMASARYPCKISRNINLESTTIYSTMGGLWAFKRLLLLPAALLEMDLDWLGLVLFVYSTFSKNVCSDAVLKYP